MSTSILENKGKYCTSKFNNCFARSWPGCVLGCRVWLPTFQVPDRHPPPSVSASGLVSTPEPGSDPKRIHSSPCEIHSPLLSLCITWPPPPYGHTLEVWTPLSCPLPRRLTWQTCDGAQSKAHDRHKGTAMHTAHRRIVNTPGPGHCNADRGHKDADVSQWEAFPCTNTHSGFLPVIYPLRSKCTTSKLANMACTSTLICTSQDPSPPWGGVGGGEAQIYFNGSRGVRGAQ